MKGTPNNCTEPLAAAPPKQAKGGIASGKRKNPGGLRSRDGLLSVRECPSTVEGTRRSFLTAPQK
jgi:hypothetical protein